VTRRDWRLIIIAFGILAVLWCVGGFIAAENADHAEANTDRIERLVVNTAAAICLQAYADEPHEVTLIQQYARGQQIRVENPVCLATIRRAQRMIEGP
jgi:hypothetical protein